MWDTLVALFLNKKVIIASVGCGQYQNRGNVLIERSTLRILGLSSDTPKFSVFERISDDLVRRINEYDYLLVTGCTTLQDHEQHQACFDAQFEKITIPKICFGGAFCCGAEDTPSLRIAKMYDLPIGARDPWTYEYLSSNGIDCELIGCPTILEGSDRSDWIADSGGEVLISSTPNVSGWRSDCRESRAVRYISHDTMSSGDDILEDGTFDRANLVITSRLHAALPAISRGIKVKFYWTDYGDSRFSLMEFLGIPLNGELPSVYPRMQIRVLRRNCVAWFRRVLSIDRSLSSSDERFLRRIQELEARVGASEARLHATFTQAERAGQEHAETLAKLETENAALHSSLAICREVGRAVFAAMRTDLATVPGRRVGGTRTPRG
jgi:hypothetical protein